MSNLYIGLMSGTSADAIDAVLVDLQALPHLLHHTRLPLSDNVRQQLLSLNTPGTNELDLAGNLDWQLGELFAQAVVSLLTNARISPTLVRAIGSHGQTIRHRPPNSTQRGFTWQIGDPNVIAQQTGITTVADFRRRDMAMQGQGAPLVPAFHKALFHIAGKDRVVINIGGIANVTWLGQDGYVSGFDTGPGNCLMDSWIGKYLQQPFDEDGAWAASGRINPQLLEYLLAHDYFQLPPPKSTGRELFNLSWLQTYLDTLPSLAEIDVQATLLEFTAQTISRSLPPVLKNQSREIFVCGGGAYNKHLMQRLQALLPNGPVLSTQSLGIAPDCIEAMAFAWLAQQTLSGKYGNLCSVTGAREHVVLGGIYPGRTWPDMS